MHPSKKFNADRYKAVIASVTATTPSGEIERKAKPIARAILKAEGFDHIRDGPKFTGTPFDFFAFRNGYPFLIELKASISQFRGPGQVQKERLTAILEQMPNVRGAILQVCFSKGEYRLIEGEDLYLVLQHRKAPLTPIVQWVRRHSRS